MCSEIITSPNLLCEQNWGDKQSNTFKVTFRTSLSQGPLSCSLTSHGVTLADLTLGTANRSTLTCSTPTLHLCHLLVPIRGSLAC